uniref:4a-hydroxytetrahydrobiopterin dehydratase n=1 Tax=Aplanochytrium stocchinoi TaxID=215587 RepID=A0A7S3PHH5_9STRA|mmetsp:Transcript_11236/g.12730  ORF Transcript_11236/g.12730 Transcript_11236/m.12730 type:complete len:128 (+) Transcript_11236:202-585(+)|eukprot:CAMPEP_0204844576 /NCGR_PEP_ID=MMETSP1347-20130617/320_1 /ASSEMBLY_ACC=CAM_ASM_000690 /TAXON_ID=215587 /ORGANISM="Aplanochytrium stocchinoi, Strain GSBS06" /LENGTH=127 /DNA_ID=CAMNT_0051984001 /DNA_START=128 /DNA_END=511 /DNA_ORIENTATION=+
MFSCSQISKRTLRLAYRNQAVGISKRVGRIRFISKLTDDEASRGLETLSGWEKEAGGLAIKKTFRFNDFVAAFGFMTKVALEAEKACHHPEWFNVYNTVEVRLTTHDASGLSNKDFALARIMDSFAK